MSHLRSKGNRSLLTWSRASTLLGVPVAFPVGSPVDLTILQEDFLFRLTDRGRTAPRRPGRPALAVLLLIGKGGRAVRAAGRAGAVGDTLRQELRSGPPVGGLVNPVRDP